uniref:Uncharacterized protein n=1 Tax=Sphaerodactylus townsendi TaxID=933632 RepID=A0ACB8FQ98_9SAUR
MGGGQGLDLHSGGCSLLGILASLPCVGLAGGMACGGGKRRADEMPNSTNTYVQSGLPNTASGTMVPLPAPLTTGTDNHPQGALPQHPGFAAASGACQLHGQAEVTAHAPAQPLHTKPHCRLRIKLKLSQPAIYIEQMPPFQKLSKANLVPLLTNYEYKPIN